jgi:hypothetical protein
MDPFRNDLLIGGQKRLQSKQTVHSAIAEINIVGGMPALLPQNRNKQIVDCCILTEFNLPTDWPLLANCQPDPVWLQSN